MDQTTPTQLSQHASLLSYDPNAVGYTNEPLYDYQTYAAVGQTNLTFFQTPTGQRPNGYGDTNMELAGQIAKGNRFEPRSIELAIITGQPVGLTAAAESGKLAAADDVLAIISTGWCEITTLNKVFERIPLSLLPSSTRLNVNSALADTTTAAAAQRSAINYAANSGPLFELAALLLDGNNSFKVTLNWAAAIALPSGVAARVGVIFRGIKYQNLQ